MVRYAMVIDIDRCNGCYNCQLACKDEFVDNDQRPLAAQQPETGHFWMKLVERERGTYPKVKVSYVALPCMQCNNAPCIEASTDNAVYQLQNGIVLIDPDKARGQREIVSSCPYGVIYWNEEEQLPQKCIFCAHLLDIGWKEPRCVEACPTLAIRFGDLDDPNSEVSKIIASGKTEFAHPEFRTKPNVYYIGLPRIFIAGTVVFGDTDECAENVEVTVTDLETGRKTTRRTNNYGDFEFEHLNMSNYSVIIGFAGYTSETINLNLRTDTYLGQIKLCRSQESSASNSTK